MKLNVTRTDANLITFDVSCKATTIKFVRHFELFAVNNSTSILTYNVLHSLLICLRNELREEFDYIILDCPAGIEQGFKNAIAGADRALVVTTPEVSAIRDADRIIGLLEAESMKRTDLIVNRIRMDMVSRGDMMSIDDVVDILSINLIGAVPDDEHIVVATNNGEPLVGDESLAGQAYMNICHRILGEEVPLLDLNEKSSVWQKISALFKK